MSDRKYSVAEIDRMRRAVEHRILFGCKPSEATGSMTSGAHNEQSLIRSVEEQLRTYILAGVEPEELE